MSRALPGGHYCTAHQGNHSHYDESNCELCRAQRERDEARARVLADVVEILSAQHTWLTRVAAINLVAGLYGQAAEVFAAADEALAATEPKP